MATQAQHRATRTSILLEPWSWLLAGAFVLVGLQIPRLSFVILWGVLLALALMAGTAMPRNVLFRVALLVVFSCVYFPAMVFMNGAATRELAWIIGVPAAYLLGYFGFRYTNHPVRLIAGLVLGFAVYASLTVFYSNVASYGIGGIFTVRLERAAVPLWSPGEKNIYATALGIQLSLGICLISAIFSGTRNTFNLLLQNRGPIYAGIIVLTMAWMLRVTRFNDKRLFIYGLIILAVAMAMSLYLMDELKFLLEAEDALSRFSEKESGALSTPRYELWGGVIAQLLTHPFGGGQMNLSGNFYAHNVWLDVANLGGLIAAVALLIFHLLHALDVYVVVKAGRDISFWVLGSVASICISLILEPVPLVSTIYFVMTFMLFGAVAGLCRNENTGTMI